MKYDDASWHYGGEFPDGSPEEYGGTHIALFLRWCFVKGWAGELHLEEEPEAVQKVIDGEMSATDFLFNYSDGKLIDVSLSDEGNAFAQRYYGDEGFYLADYAEHFGELMYVASEAEHDFAKFSAMVNARVGIDILTEADARSQAR
jgi:hypothetical protein